MPDAKSFSYSILGKTKVSVGRLGVSGGYGAPAEAFEMAFEKGCNYFYHGSIRRNGMNLAIKNLCGKGKRDKLIIAAQIYTRGVWFFNWSFNRFLKKTGLDYIDVLLLGWYSSHPKKDILDSCIRLKNKGLVRFIGISGHNRNAFPDFAKTEIYDLFHIRYNAAHRGAETEVFNRLEPLNRPGIVTYTATRWGGLINPKKMPEGEKTPHASDCYRFVLSNPNVDVCISAPKNIEEMKEALISLDRGPLTENEIAWMCRVGDHLKVS